MGYDISYHPVDLALLHDRLIPYVLGEGSIDDLAQEAARLATVRFHANAWGLGLLSQSYGNDGIGLDAQLHVWGRPFLIDVDDPAEISRAIDAYLAADQATGVGLAQTVVEALAPGVEVQPSRDGGLPEGDALLKSVRWKLDLFRDAYAALERGEATLSHDGNELEIRGLFGTDVANALIEFAANLRPGWMARGRVWPTLLIAEADVDPPGTFRPVASVFAPMIEKVPETVQKLQDGTIVENYMLGGYVAPSDVAQTLEFFAAHEEALAAPLTAEGEGEYVRTCLRKIREALHDAQLRGMGFLEATEIYSAPMGIMN